MQSYDATGVGLEFGPVAHGRTADGFDVETHRYDEAEAKDSGTGNVGGDIGRENGAIFADGDGVLGFDTDIRLDGGGFERSGGFGFGVTKCAADGEPGDVGLQRGDGSGRKIFQVDG